MPQSSNINTSNLLIDITRLIGRFLYGYLPTGIDRVTISYVNHYGKNARAFIYFKSVYAVFSASLSSEVYLLLTQQDINTKNRWKIFFLLIKGILFSRLEKNIEGSILLNIDHVNLDRTVYKRIIQRLNFHTIFVLHDLIPIFYPEYCREGDDKRHLIRIDTMLTVGKGIVTNSQDTLENLKLYADKNGYRVPPSIVAFLAPPAIETSLSCTRPLSKPYFVMLSTIEPRKNHMLILHIWRSLFEQLGEDAPALVIIGKRGWECENIIDLLDRSIALKNMVIELNYCRDEELSNYLYGAQALLFPSFAEGYGFPLIEAISHKTPVIASNLRVFQEIAGDIPEYIDPLDGKEWKKMILNYTDNKYHLRVSQLKKIESFNIPTWNRHFYLVDNFINLLH